MVSLENGSALIWISCKIKELNEAFFNSATILADSLETNPEVSDADDINDHAEKLSEGLDVKSYKDTSKIKIDPWIDPMLLGQIFQSISALNDRLLDGEAASIGFGYPGEKDFSTFKTINKNFKVNGNVVDMLSKVSRGESYRGKFYVNILANKGVNVWRLEDVFNNKKFSAKILDTGWLDSYQSGETDPIGPNDIIDAQISCDVVVLNGKRKDKFEVKNAKVSKVFSILRNKGRQDDLF